MAVSKYELCLELNMNWAWNYIFKGAMILDILSLYFVMMIGGCMGIYKNYLKNSSTGSNLFKKEIIRQFRVFANYCKFIEFNRESIFNRGDYSEE